LPAHANSLVWTGGGTPNGNWNNSANWGSIGIPGNGDTVVFQGTVNLVNTNNFAGLTLSQVRFIGATGGFDIRGNAFTITGGIEATNSAGLANVIENDITLATVDQIVDVTNSLTLSGKLSGGVGLIKNGPGTLLLNGTNSNTYGKTTVNAGLVQMAKNGGLIAAVAIPGDLVIGDGASSTTVQNIFPNEIADTANITINNNGTWDMNGKSDVVGTNLTLNGTSTVAIETGSITLTAPSTITVSNSLGSSAKITGSGSIQLGAGPCVINVSNGAVLEVYPSVQGAAAITKTGGGHLHFYGANTYTGLTTVSAGWFWAQNPLALGGTSSGTVVSNGATLVVHDNITITNEPLTLNGPGEPFYAALDSEDAETNGWAGPITNNADTTFGAYGFGTLHIMGPITGVGGVTEDASGGTVTFEGNTANTYAGTTTVNNGTLLLYKTSVFDGAIPHDLVVNDTVRNLSGNQIANSSTVTIGATGVLDLSGFLATNNILGAPVHTANSSGNYTLGYSFTPSTNLLVTHVRSYFGTKVEIWTDTGTLLASQNVVSTPGTWVETPLATPIQLNAGTTYRVAAYTAGGGYYFRSDLGGPFPYGTINQSYEIAGDAFPTGTDSAKWWFVDLRYTVLASNFEGDAIGSLNGSGSVNLGAGFINFFGSGSHTYNGVISGAGTFYMEGSPLTCILNGNNTYTGPTYLIDGLASTLKINGFQPQSAVYVGNQATLGGSGTVGIITNNGTISPGTSPVILNSSNVVFGASGNYTVELTGPNPGVGGYDQLNVAGTVSLGNASLTVIPAFTTPVAIGQQFTIVNNDLSDAVVGTFNGLPNGSTISTGGYKFVINYSSAFGNDVVLTLTNIPGAVISAAVTSGDGSHNIDPDGCNNLDLVITNLAGSVVTMTGITASLATTTPGVVVTGPVSGYPDILPNGKGTNLAPFQITVMPSFVCGSDINLQLSVNSSLGAYTMNFVLHTAMTAAPVRFDNNTPTNCPDIGAIDSTNTVAGWTGGAIRDVTVSLWLVAPIDSDMSLSLIAPDNTTVPLVAGVGAGANFGTGSADASRTTFDDFAATAIASGSAPFVDTFRPQGALTNFIGTTANGAWHLHVQDSFGSGSSDTLRNWSLFLSGTACVSGSGACDLCPNISFTSVMGPGTPLQNNIITLNSVASVCGVSKTCPGTTVTGGSFPAENFTFHNGPTAACITVTLQNTNPAVDMLVSAYSSGYNPADAVRCDNYLADSGFNVGPGYGSATRAFSFNVASNATFFVNVIASGYSPYQLTVTGGDCSPALNITTLPGNQARLNWPTWAGGYKLEATPSLVPTNWAYITNEPFVSALKYNVTNSTFSPTNRFYRLHKP